MLKSTGFLNTDFCIFWELWLQNGRINHYNISKYHGVSVVILLRYGTYWTGASPRLIQVKKTLIPMLVKR